MRLKLLVLISTALLLGGSPATAAPGEDIGAAVKIVNLVTAEYETDQRRLAQGDNVRQDELIEVGTDGTGEIRLRDNTQLALGPWLAAAARRIRLQTRHLRRRHRPQSRQGQLPIHHRHRRQAGICHSHAVSGDHRAWHDFRRLCSDKRHVMAAADRRCHRSLQREGRLRTARRAGQTHSHHTRRRPGQSRQVGQPAEGWPAVRGGFPVRCSPAVVRVGPRVHARRHRRGRCSGRARRQQR